MISRERLEELRKELPEKGVCNTCGLLDHWPEISDTLSAALKVVEVAKAYCHGEDKDPLCPICEALIPFTSEPLKGGKGSKEKE